jgi:signal transduction histidine kinase
MAVRLRGALGDHPTHPAPKIRLKLTLIYGGVFLVTGAVLLTIGYAFVRHNLDARPGDYRLAERKLGLSPSALPPHAFHRDAADNSLINAVRAQLRSDVLRRLVVDYVLALVVMTIVSVGAGWLLAGRALSPLRRIIATARRVSGENLGERIDLHGPADELKELADTFDRMLERLDGAFASQRHFVASASHELRTPLAIMRTEVDVALADGDASVEDLREMGEGVRDTVDRCERLIESLLMLARSEAMSGREQPVDLAALAADCLTDMRARAEEAGISTRVSLAPAWAPGEPRLLERMIANLIDNGIRHNLTGGYLEVSTSTEQDRVRVIVRNGGAVIPAEAAGRLTEPFTRVDRTRPGFGLGLSIVDTVATAHGGQATVRAPADGGLEVVVALPATAAPAPRRRPERARTLTGI